jgi:murein DD-endopeptidase MepM/ murein hydrolase activator NlpD
MILFISAGDDLEQGRLPGTVGADQTDPITLGDNKIQLGKKELGAKRLGNRAAGNDSGHENSLSLFSDETAFKISLFYLDSLTRYEYKQNIVRASGATTPEPSDIIQTETAFNNHEKGSAMNDRYHIIVTGENGRSSSFQISKKGALLSLSSAIILVLSVCVFGYFTTGSYLSNKLLTKKVHSLQTRLTTSEQATKDYLQQIADLKQAHQTELLALIEEQQDTLADQKMSFDLENTNLQLENLRLMNTAVSDLNQRSELIETVMHTIGVKIKDGTSGAEEGSGGPYVPADETSYDDLLQKVDDYLEAVRLMPLGRPVSGSISSAYGKRSDPINGKNAFHEGVDIRGERGEKVFATAAGTVSKAFKNGGYGNYVELDHGNGYRTVYAHLQNYLVKPGERVEQGQVIGQVGDTGRSTGAHLHYEIRLGNKPINPTKFMKVADITQTAQAKQK